MEPLTGQPVAVQRENTIEEGVPLLDRQRAVLTIDQTQLVVQTRMRGARANEQSRDGRNHRDQHPTDCLHVVTDPSALAQLRQLVAGCVVIDTEVVFVSCRTADFARDIRPLGGRTMPSQMKSAAQDLLRRCLTRLGV